MSNPVTDWSGWFVERYEKEVRAGLHDEQCERMPAEGWHICDCRKRDRLARGITEPPGELIHNYPTCPGCYRETWHDGDSFRCDHCHATWPESYSDHAVFDDEVGDVAADRQKWLDRRKAS